MPYAFPQLHNRYGDYGVFRVSGAGLGNLLFPWARAVVAARDYELRLIWPTWLQLNPARRWSLLKEYARRHYGDLFQRPPHYIGGFERLRLLATADRTNEQEFLGHAGELGDEVVVFRGMDSYFDTIARDHIHVRTELLRMVHPRHRGVLSEDLAGCIAVNVRLGDFSEPSDLALLETGAVNYRLPMAWYRDQVETLRRSMGSEVPVLVVSDGSPDQLHPLLRLPGTRYVTYGSAIADLLALSQCGVLVASGSTFSMWASFLGRMPVVWYRGQMRQPLYYERPEAEAEVRLGEALPDGFLSTVGQLRS